ncbi:MAG: hypothetical protein GY778_20135, partial [bacterium]|nr:hypothetical protein [bacterium]
GNITLSGSPDNDAAVTADGGSLLINGAVTNDGSVTATSGDIAITGSLTNNAAGAMTAAGGHLTTYAAVSNNGTITANGGNVTFSSGDVANSGTITATGGTDVTFSGTISKWSTGLFQVTAAGSDMTLNQTNTPNLTGDGDFSVEAGRMWFKQSLTTAGGYRQTGGKTEVAAGKTFTATGAY